MEFIEISAKNVDDAITQATVQLGITSDQLEYEVLDKGSTGFLGIGSKNAVIKARKKFSIDENVVEFLSSIFDAMKMEVEILVADYRKRRKETLENLAKNIAYKVKRIKRPVSLEPMNPFERRIIHSALQNDRYVTTHSEGDEPYRHVVVTLKK